MIYLDYAATSLKKPESVYREVARVLRHGASVGRGAYPAAAFSAERVYACRTALRELFGLPSEDCAVFTYNATMALNTAIKGLLADGGEAVISGYEHNAVVRPLKALERRGVRFTAVPAPLFETEALVEGFRRAITPGTRLVVCTHVSNVFGYVLPIREIDALCAERGVPLVIDAAQSAGAVPLRMDELSAVRFICAPGHKGLYGPQGTGILLCRDAAAATLVEGGTGSESISEEQPAFLPDRFEAGTVNAAGIAGLGEGVRYVSALGVERILAHEKALIRQAAEALAAIPRVRVWAGEPQAGALSFAAEGLPCETVAQRLAEGGIAVRAGLHCAPLAHRTAGTLAGGTVRVSVSAFTVTEHIDALVRGVRAALR